MSTTSNDRQQLDTSFRATDLHVSLAPNGIHLLLEAYHCARELNADIWEFAVELGCLRAAGLTKTHLRWLLSKGYALQAVERSEPAALRRTFEEVSNLTLPEGTCLVLTEAGAAYVLGSVQQRGTEVRANDRPQSPVWDEVSRELRVGSDVVKRFKQPAVNQEWILRAFQEEGWPPRIDDPLPPETGQDPKRRLHSTISNLNRSQPPGIKVHFMGGGDGESICWRLWRTAGAGNGGAKAARV